MKILSVFCLTMLLVFPFNLRQGDVTSLLGQEQFDTFELIFYEHNSCSPFKHFHNTHH